MIQNELQNKTHATSGLGGFFIKKLGLDKFGFFGLGARDQTTAELYKSILNICNDQEEPKKSQLVNV